MALISKRNFAALSLAAILLIVPDMPTLAAPCADAAAVTGLCGHHAEHTDECLAQTACSHVHTEDCYNFSANCVHVHTNACRRNCTHICTEKSGCIVSQLNCCHVHNEDCVFAEGAVCSYACDTCGASYDGSQSGNYCYTGRNGSHRSSHHSRRHHC